MFKILMPKKLFLYRQSNWKKNNELYYCLTKILFKPLVKIK